MPEKAQSPVQENKKAAASPQQKVDSGSGGLAFNDSRAEVVSLKGIQAAADDSVNLKKITQLQGKAGSSQTVLTQLQEKANQSRQNNPIQRKANNTGLPDNLKTGIESLSGVSMDSVKVHKNSDKPAQLNAHAYAQGSDIHLGSGQEKHLPHEAWHVVQQSQGRVKPTTQMAGVNINDNKGLEKEADVMGSKALQKKSKGADITQLKSSQDNSSEVAQLVGIWKRIKNAIKGTSSDQQGLLAYSELSDEGPEEDIEAPVAAAPAAAAPIEQEGTKIEAGPFTYQDGTITFEVWEGQEITFGREGVSGDLPNKVFNMDIGSFDASIDIPFAPGVYAIVSLGITPTLALTIAGGTFAIDPQNKSLEIQNAGVTGTMGLDITAKAGIGAGLANVAGLEAGGFATLGGQAKLGGSLAGIVDFTNKKAGVNLSLNATADIVGKAGVFIQAKALMLSAEKKWILAEKTFAQFKYEKSASIARGKGAWLPNITDFTPIESGDRSKENFLETDEGKILSEYSDTDSLLGGSQRSDS